MKKPVKLSTAFLFSLIALTGLLGCGPTMYKSPVSGDVVPITLWATDLNKRSILYTDELVAVYLVDPATEEELGLVRLEYANPKQQIKVYAGKPVTVVFAELDPHLGYTIECHGELEFTPEANAQYMIKYDFKINKDSDIHADGDCYAVLLQISQAGQEKIIKREIFTIVKMPS